MEACLLHLRERLAWRGAQTLRIASAAAVDLTIGLYCKVTNGLRVGPVSCVSGSDLEQFSDEFCLGFHIASTDVFHLALADHRHGFVARNRCPCGRQALETHARPNQPFDAAMVLINDIVVIFHMTHLREAPAYTLRRQLG